MLPEWIATSEGDRRLADCSLPLDLEGLLPGGASWEVELGIGKGNYLLAQAEAHPERRYVGVEVAPKYFRIARDRGRRRGLRNFILLRADAEYLLAAGLPRDAFSVLHVYFPDPWPKSRHEKRRLLSPDSIDLILGLLVPGGSLYFATDANEYGATVRELLEAQPGIQTQRLDSAWPDGPRTNYEIKYRREGRPIARLVATRTGALAGDPAAPRRELVAAGWSPDEEEPMKVAVSVSTHTEVRR